MKRIILCALALTPLITAQPHAPSSRQPTSIKGYLQGPNALDTVPQFVVLFDGKKIRSDSNGFFTIPLDPEDGRYKLLYLLICGRTAEHTIRNNTIDGLQINPGKFHKFYKLFPVYDAKAEKTEWKFESATFAHQHYVTPSNCIVLTMNPAYVAKLAPWNLELGDTYIKLPKIVLRDSLVTQLSAREKRVGRGTLKRVAHKSELYALDTNRYHTSVRNEVRGNVSLPY